MSKAPTTPEFKIQLCEKYLSGEGSYQSLAAEYGIGATSLLRWVAKYREKGPTCFYRSHGNARYSKEFKEQCINDVLSVLGSVNEIVAKYNISHESVLRKWIMQYNANMELKEYNPKREVYMAEARRKTTLRERKEIVEYCVEHNKDYKGTAALFEVSYSQVYS